MVERLTFWKGNPCGEAASPCAVPLEDKTISGSTTQDIAVADSRPQAAKSEGKATAAARKHLPWIVGVGASAGGLEALREFVRSLEASGQFSYVIAQHLSPTHRSMLMELLDREDRKSVV